MKESTLIKTREYSSRKCTLLFSVRRTDEQWRWGEESKSDTPGLCHIITELPRRISWAGSCVRAGQWEERNHSFLISFDSGFISPDRSGKFTRQHSCYPQPFYFSPSSSSSSFYVEAFVSTLPSFCRLWRYDRLLASPRSYSSSSRSLWPRLRKSRVKSTLIEESQWRVLW